MAKDVTKSLEQLFCERQFDRQIIIFEADC